MFLLKLLLFPLSILYGIGIFIRNYLYNHKILKAYEFEVPMINVGNLRVGGTGKTPHVEYLIKMLNETYKIATLSRGYGRKTKGFILADISATAANIGDEPFQFYKKFEKDIAVAVCEDRAMAIPQILAEKHDRDLIILDDAFQHRAVKADINILLSDYSQPFYSDLLLPAGRLREPAAGAKRADIIIITKCPEHLTLEQKSRIEEKVRHFSGNEIPIFFSGLKYGIPLTLFPDQKNEISKEVFLVSGIANPSRFKAKVSQDYKLIGEIEFKDHHDYNAESVKKIIKQFEKAKGNDKSILVTEKDMVKLIEPSLKALWKDIPVFYFPIEVYFLWDKDKFGDLIFQKLLEKKSKVN